MEVQPDYFAMLDEAEEIIANIYSDDLGFKENEDDLDSGQILATKAVIGPTDWTVETIVSQLSKTNLDLDPAFQRRGAWTASRKSKFIESLILGLPIPQIVLATSKEERGKYIVIDGKQRLLSLHAFFLDQTNPLRLSGLDFLKDLNGMTLEEIRKDRRLVEYLNNLENQAIRSVVIKNWDTEQFLYLTFYRLNSGSLPLSSQELRQALMPGPFVNFINKVTSTTELYRSMLDTEEPDFRMRDVELIIRFIAFKMFRSNYSGNLRKFLDETCSELNRTFDERVIKGYLFGLFKAIETTKVIFGEQHAFRKWNGTDFERKFNRSVFDIMTYEFSEKELAQRAIEKKVLVKQLFIDLCTNNQDFKTSLEVTTKSIGATNTRYDLWRSELQKLLP